MRAALIWLASVAVYLVGWQHAARYVGRILMVRGHCHQEQRSGGGYRWSDRSSCERWDQPDCWRSDERLEFRAAGLAALIALAWPVALAPLWVMRTVHPAPSPIQKDIDRLERELGMGA